MRRSWLMGVTAALSLALMPSAVLAGNVEEQLAEMQKRLGTLEQRLDATTDELEAANQRVEQQEQLIQESGLTDARGASSGLASFLDTLEIGGWVAASYTYNFNDPDNNSLGGANQGAPAFAYPFHPDANSFQLDQLWFELEKPVSADSRAGFRADIHFGKTAEILSNSGGLPNGTSLDEEALEVYQAYVQYLAPINIGEGVKFKAGKFGTTIGAEVAPTVYNLNITRGHVYNLLQPITHVGVMATAENNGASAGIGIVNDTAYIDVDNNDGKAVLWHLGYGEDTWGASLNGIWGSSTFSNAAAGTTNDEEPKETIVDLILNWDPTDEFTSYINATWRQFEADGSRDADAFGVAIAGRYAINERLGLAIRGEYVDDEDGITALTTQDLEIYSATGTLDYSLTEDLLLRAEVRWDYLDDGDDGTFAAGGEPVFIDDGSDRNDDQIVGAVEVIYNF